MLGKLFLNMPPKEKGELLREYTKCGFVSAPLKLFIFVVFSLH